MIVFFLFFISYICIYVDLDWISEFLLDGFMVAKC
jgi:hypothetical protein